MGSHVRALHGGAIDRAPNTHRSWSLAAATCGAEEQGTSSAPHVRSQLPYHEELRTTPQQQTQHVHELVDRHQAVSVPVEATQIDPTF